MLNKTDDSIYKFEELGEGEERRVGVDRERREKKEKMMSSDIDFKGKLAKSRQ